MSSPSRSSSMLHLSILFIICLGIVAANDCSLSPSDPHKVAYTITVSKLPGDAANYTMIQPAINSIPQGNDKWIRILVRQGVYREQVVVNKPCILLEGDSRARTFIVFNSHQQLNTSQTFNVKSEAKNFIAKRISFKNDYNFMNHGVNNWANPDVKPAVAALISAPKASFYHCGFYGVQDTIWDRSGRHYFFECYIQGQVDFICGNGQSIYQNCIISILGDGYITAQKRQGEEETSGFVFNKGVVIGQGNTYLGRAWGSHSRVIFHTTSFNTSIVPHGWSAWDKNQKGKFTYVEAHCMGPGNSTEHRQLEKKLTINELESFTQLSYIDSDGWLSIQPID